VNAPLCKIHGTPKEPGKVYAPNRLKWWCRACKAEYGKMSRRRYAERYPFRVVRAKIRRRCRKYGFPVSEYIDLFVRQHGCCLICGEKTMALVIDHDHETGVVRGLLCVPCNKALGLFRDDPTRIQQAVYYLTGVANE
jgi:Recombination endonuclease VII